MPGVGLILLAAGCSKRMGQPKQLLSFEGETLLRRAARTAIQSSCRPIIVVLGAYRNLVDQEFADLDVHVVQNAEWDHGLGSSIRTGMQALISPRYPEVDAVVFTMCDQPLVTAAYIDEMVEAYKVNGTVIASTYQDTLGVPALFPSALFPDLFSLEGNTGAKLLLEKVRDSAVLLPFQAGAMDIDTAGDYSRLVSAAK